MKTQVSYTVMEKHALADWQRKGQVGSRVVLTLDPQPGAPVLHWGSLPHALTLCGADEALPPLLGKVTLTMEYIA